MNLWQKSLVVLVLCGLSYSTGRYLTPEKVITKEVVVEKEVVKEVFKENVKKNTQTKIVETIFPDGKKVTETYILNQDTIVIEKEVVAEKEIRKEIEKIIQNKKTDYRVAAAAGSKGFQIKPEYTISVEKRMIGPIFAGIYGRTDREFGLSVGLEF